MPNQKKFLSGDNLVTYDGIIKDWVDDKAVELTQAEYDLLDPPDPDVTYYITDAQGGGGGASTAEDVSYDNTTSGMTADDVQEAIDELHTGLGGKANGAGLTFSVDQDGILCVTYQEVLTYVNIKRG